MKATIYYGTRDVRVETVPDPKLVEPTDAIVRITHACICGSDLWFYRGESKTWQPGFRTGHEWIGVVEDVGRSVTSLERGDRVIAPFAYSDGDCEFCVKNVQTSCVNGGFWGGENDGGQAEAIRAQFADATLVKVPDAASGDDAMMRALLPLTDVLGTGHHAALSAKVKRGTTAAVIGDGAVGLCGVLAAKRLGAERIIAFGRHSVRTDIARRFGATDVVSARGEEAIERALELTHGGAEAVLECVGNEDSMRMASGMARPGGTIGFVGVPYGSKKGLNLSRMFSENITLAGGVAPVRAYLPELLADVLAGNLDASPIFDLSEDLDGVPAGYAAMDERSAIKVMVKP